MKKFLFAASAAVIAAITPVAANAAVLLPSFDAFGGFTFASTSPLPTPSFTDTVSFVATTSGVYTGSISSNNAIKFTAFTAGSAVGSTLNFGPASYGQIGGFNVVAGNSYTVTVSGTNTSPTANYTGNFTLTAVPEPATWAMMLTGFGLVGYAARSRRKAFAAA